MKRLLKVVLAVFAGFVIISVSAISYLLIGQSAGKNLTINAVDFQNLKDGTYIGEYQGGRWSNKLAITVKDGKVTGIDIQDDVQFAKPEWTKQLVDTVINTQSLEVDAISGATITSKAYLKAMENALVSAQR